MDFRVVNQGSGSITLPAGEDRRAKALSQMSVLPMIQAIISKLSIFSQSSFFSFLNEENSYLLKLYSGICGAKLIQTALNSAWHIVNSR